MENKDLKFEKHVPYYVDFDYLDENVLFSLSAPNKNLEEKKFSEIILFFQNNKVVEPTYASFSKGIGVKCEDQEFSIQCENLIARQVLSTLLNLQRENKSLNVDWYPSDYDSCNEMPQFIHSFFLAGNSEIIDENVRISTSWMDKCDPNILIRPSIAESTNSSMPLWSNMEGDQKAIALWYYQKFYKETRNGQILSIRKSLESIESPITSKKDVSSPTEFLARSSSEVSLLSSINRKLGWIVVILGIILIQMIL